jgi:hypothetical protein
LIIGVGLMLAPLGSLAAVQILDPEINMRPWDYPKTLPFALIGCAFSFVGLTLAFGRCRISARDGELIAVEGIGPFKWTRRRAMRSLREAEVRRVSPYSNSAEITDERRDRYGKITFVAMSGRSLTCAWLHRREELLARAEEFRRIRNLPESDAAPPPETI